MAAEMWNRRRQQPRALVHGRITNRSEPLAEREYLANGGRWIAQPGGTVFAAMRGARMAPQKAMRWDAEKARCDGASVVH
jgi:hypothetical protein